MEMIVGCNWINGYHMEKISQWRHMEVCAKFSSEGIEMARKMCSSNLVYK